VHKSGANWGIFVLFDFLTSHYSKILSKIFADIKILISFAPLLEKRLKEHIKLFYREYANL